MVGDITVEITESRAKSNSSLIDFIIHLKYFPDSDWLKAHAQFTLTSY